ncbi:MAG: hypothetical protein IJO63_00695 [Bacilli bacterium]|nr:hypothetical protein [Bacilli bacterium]
MVTLNEQEAIQYTGGGKITTGFVIFFTAITSFVLGVFDGLSNPKACNSK